MQTLKIGFIPLADCAPLVIALEHGHFAAQGLQVELGKAQSWEQARAKLESGEFQAAHLLATLPLLSALGVDGSQCLFSSAWTLSHCGNAITLSNRLCRAGVHDGTSLAAWLDTPDAPELLRLGVVHPRSTHELMLREWLQVGGLEIGKRIELLYSPPQEMVRRLREGEIDGFCAGEPWNQRATSSKLGGIVAIGEDVMAPGMEKVLAVRRDWHETHKSEHAALLRALHKASEWLNRPENLDEAAHIVAGKRYVNTQEILLRNALHRCIQAGWGQVRMGKRFLRFGGPGVNRPDPAAFQWYLERLVWWGHAPSHSLDLDLSGICLDSFHREVFPEGDGLDRAFAFENPFVTELRCIPMAVRRKLDLIGLKLSLGQWTKFSLDNRRFLMNSPIDHPHADWGRQARALLLELGEEARTLEIEALPAWRVLEHVPADVTAQAQAHNCTLPLASWRSLDELQRFALVKLSRQGHENRNFLPALQEFGLH